MSHQEMAVPIRAKLFSPGVRPLLVLMAIGIVAAAYRFFFGLRASTNLSQLYPWGIWIIADVSFIAIAAGGFTTAAIAHVFHRHEFHSLARPALITAMLGYTFACVALAADLGRYYNIWHPMLPSMWQGNSALFEVGMCVMCYVTVLYIEFVPVFCERFIGDLRHPLLDRVCSAVHHSANRVMAVFIVLGVGISCLHQSSLGHVMALVPTKLHPLWHSPVLALLFLLSAIAVGFPTVIFACIVGPRSLKLEPDMKTLGRLARYAPVLLSIYLAAKLADMVIRGTFVHLGHVSMQSLFFIVEVAGGVALPIVLLSMRRVRRSPGLLALACLLAMLGVVLNRVNVYWIGYSPPFATHMYFPSLAEWALTVGIVAGIAFLWRALAIWFPVMGVPVRTRAV